MTKVTFRIKDDNHPHRTQTEQAWEFSNTDEIASFFRTAKACQAAGWSFEIITVERDGVEIGS